jgi:hypothetical protein
MKVRDNEVWQQQRADLLTPSAQDPECKIGKLYLEFLEMWAEKAEFCLAEENFEANPSQAVRLGLILTENHFGRQTIGTIGQMLCLLLMHWEHSKELDLGLTEIEKRLVQDITAIKIATMQQQAQHSDVGGG